MAATRTLTIVADDFGIGPETSRAILELAARGVVTGTVLLVNAPHAADAVRRWRAAGRPAALGWHPCLTLDPPAAPPQRVPSLVGPDGCLRPLGAFLARLHLGLVATAEIEVELRAQYDRFVELVGRPPALVNSHQHVALFGQVGLLLEKVLREHGVRPYFRRVREPWSVVRRIPGARVKRALLNALGRQQGRRLDQAGYPGNDWLAGVTDPGPARDPAFFRRWLAAVPGRAVELCCHPGHADATLVGRDCRSLDDPLLARRVDELRWLSDPALPEAIRAAGFTLTTPGEIPHPRGLPHAA